MKELIEILDAIDRHAREGQQMALATIVGVRGSTYRREGARLLCTERQQMIGNISGGCLESDIMVVAEDVMATGRPRMVTYDLTADDDMVWGLGLGCNGAVDVFVEHVDPASPVLPLLRDAIVNEKSLGLVTIMEGVGTTGARLAVYADGTRIGTLGEARLDERAKRAALAAIEEGLSRVQTLPVGDGEVKVFVESIRPPIRLVVCGAGHDAIPVVQFAAMLGWRTIVVDQRERFLTRERFPGAREFIKADPAEAAALVPIDSQTYVVVMTHNYLHDRDLLRGFLRSGAPYVGMLGPRIRTEKILSELQHAGLPVSDRDRARIFGPVGLDLGSEGPEEIALAVVGEILAVESGRQASFLRERTGPIHAETKVIGRGS
ncbi:MAG: XdhC family protein [Armatimonadetes bacterium]|nr:XdhC family protein [Armatimonadota bacterium]